MWKQIGRWFGWVVTDVQTFCFLVWPSCRGQKMSCFFVWEESPGQRDELEIRCRIAGIARAHDQPLPLPLPLALMRLLDSLLRICLVCWFFFFANQRSMRHFFVGFCCSRKERKKQPCNCDRWGICSVFDCLFLFSERRKWTPKKMFEQKKKTHRHKEQEKKASRTFPRSAVSTTQTPLLPTLLKKPTTLTIKDLCMQSFDRTNAT
jgi:hypothetical protein